MVMHPGPWKLWRQFGENDDVGGVEDADGKHVFSANDVGEVGFSDSEAERLVLSAPELLDILKRAIATSFVGMEAEHFALLEEARVLIVRIEQTAVDEAD